MLGMFSVSIAEMVETVMTHVTVSVDSFNVERCKVGVFVVLEFRVSQTLF